MYFNCIINIEIYIVFFCLMNLKNGNICGFLKFVIFDFFYLKYIMFYLLYYLFYIIVFILFYICIGYFFVL